MISPHPRILVIDPQPVLREGVTSVLSAALRGSDIAGSGDFTDALNRVGSQSFDLVVSDFRIQGDTALSFLPQLGIAAHGTRCLILTALDEIQVGYPCMRAGASGFIRKSSPIDDLVDAARTIMAGRQYLSERLAKALMDSGGPDARSHAGSRLTPRELQVFSLTGEGLSVSLIAIRLGVSVKTVEAHREHIKNKLGYQNAAQLAAAAVRWLDDTSVAI